MPKLLIDKIFYTAILILSVFFMNTGYQACKEDAINKVALNERGKVTIAVVRERCNGVRGKTEFHYEFKVGEKTYPGYFAGYDNWLCYPGDSIEVRYDSINPINNKRVDKPIPVEKESNTILYIILGVIICAIYLFFAYRNMPKSEK